MQKKVVMLAALVLFLGGCSSIIKKPEILDVKKMAIISFYTNGVIRHYESKQDAKQNLNVLGAVMGLVVKPKDKSLNSENVQVTTYGFKSLIENLSSLNRWSIIPPSETINNPTMQKINQPGEEGNFMGDLLNLFAKAIVDEWITPPGLPYIPIDSIIDNVIYLGQNPKAETLSKLAQLAKELNVDAVGVVFAKLGYKTGGFLGLRVEIFGVEHAAPAVALHMVAVNQNGQVVMNAPMGWVVGDVGGPLLRGGQFTLVDEKGENVNAYCKAMDKASGLLKIELEKEFQKQ